MCIPILALTYACVVVQPGSTGPRCPVLLNPSLTGAPLLNGYFGQEDNYAGLIRFDRLCVSGWSF